MDPGGVPFTAASRGHQGSSVNPPQPCLQEANGSSGLDITISRRPAAISHHREFALATTFCGIPALFPIGGPLPTHQPFLPPPLGLHLCLSPSASQAAPRNSAGKFSSLFVARFAFQGLPGHLQHLRVLTIFFSKQRTFSPEMNYVHPL